MCGRAIRRAAAAATLIACAPPAPDAAPPRGTVAATPAPIESAAPVPAGAVSDAGAVPVYAVAEGEEVEDDVSVVPEGALQPSRAHPLDGWSDERIERAVVEDIGALGPLSVGRPGAGALVNGVPMPPGDRWDLVDPVHAWGTRETIDDLERCIDAVHAAFPESPPMYIGHISAEHGGPLAPHVSHQAGRDVDVSYFYTRDHRWFRRAHAGNLDQPRTWAFVRALVTRTDVELILIDAYVQRLLRQYALSIGEDAGWLHDVFDGRPGALPPLIRHAKGHATHIHVRFYNPLAQEAARRAYPLLVKHHVIAPLRHVVRHRVRRGDTLGKLARRYRTTVRNIQRANGLRSTLIRAGRTIRIPSAVGTSPAPGPLSLPARRLPPTARSSADEADGGAGGT